MKKAWQFFFLFSFILSLMVPAVLAAADKPIQLKWADFSTPTARTRAVEWWISEVQKQSGGKVKIDAYLSESLIKAMDMPEAVRSGTVDLGTFVAAYYPDRIPAWTVVDVAGITDPYAVMMSMWELNEAQPAMQADMDKWNGRMMIPQCVGETVIAFRPKVMNLDGFKGKKVRAVGYQALFMNAVGAVPVPLPHPEIHMSLERGAIDGALGFAYTACAYGYQEIAPNWVRGVSGNYAIPVVMNKDSWKKLPKDIQDLMTKLAREAVKVFAEEIKKADAECIEKNAKSPKGSIVFLSAADIERWKSALKPVQQKWAKDMEAKGIPAEKVLNAYFETAKKYGGK